MKQPSRPMAPILFLTGIPTMGSVTISQHRELKNQTINDFYFIDDDKVLNLSSPGSM
jgi:hypothetical protein